MPGCACAIVGCSTNSKKNRGLSFFQLKRPKYPEWERALVRAVNRVDPAFKDGFSRSRICSRHFEDSCFEFQECEDGIGLPGRRLIPGSIPTRWMPKRKFDKEHTPRKAPFERAAAEMPIVVKYYNFGEVQKAASHDLPTPWILVKSTDEEIIVVVVDGDLVKLHVNIKPDFSTSVRALGFPVMGQYSAGNIESISLKRYLQNLSEMNICPGVTDAVFQKYADLPISDTKKMYFKHIQYVTIDNIITHTSTVRSTLCVLLTGILDGLCKECTKIRCLLQKKHERALASEMKPLDPSTPLTCVTPQKLIEELKSERKKNKHLQQQLDIYERRWPDESPLTPTPQQEPVKRVIESNSGSSLFITSKQALPNDSQAVPHPSQEPVKSVIESNSGSSLCATPKQSLPNVSPVIAKNGRLMTLMPVHESVIMSKTGFRSLLHPNNPSPIKALMVPKPQNQSVKSVSESNSRNIRILLSHPSQKNSSHQMKVDSVIEPVSGSLLSPASKQSMGSESLNKPLLNL